jgi:hypothetical protein
VNQWTKIVRERGRERGSGTCCGWSEKSRTVSR